MRERQATVHRRLNLDLHNTTSSMHVLQVRFDKANATTTVRKCEHSSANSRRLRIIVVAHDQCLYQLLFPDVSRHLEGGPTRRHIPRMRLRTSLIFSSSAFYFSRMNQLRQHFNKFSRFIFETERKRPKCDHG